MTWLRWIGSGVWGLVADASGKSVDVPQLILVAGLACLGYGASLIYVPAAYLAVGAVLVWWTLPARGPFFYRGDRS